MGQFLLGKSRAVNQSEQRSPARDEWEDFLSHNLSLFPPRNVRRTCSIWDDSNKSSLNSPVLRYLCETEDEQAKLVRMDR